MSRPAPRSPNLPHNKAPTLAGSTCLPLRVSVLFQPVITCAAGEQLCIVQLEHRRVIVLLQRKQEREGGSESPSVRAFKVDPRACFGSEDESPAGRGCSTPWPAAGSAREHNSTLIVECQVCVFRLQTFGGFVSINGEKASQICSCRKLGGKDSSDT